MAGRQIRWRSVGRAAAVAAAVIAGIISLPALLGSDKPPPVPADVGLAPTPASAPVASPAEPVDPNAATKTDPDGSGKFLRDRRRNSPRRRLATEGKNRGRSHSRREGPHPDSKPDHRPDPAPPPPSLPVQSPPAYSYVPPPSPGEFHFER